MFNLLIACNYVHEVAHVLAHDLPRPAGQLGHDRMDTKNPEDIRKEQVREEEQVRKIIAGPGDA